MKFAENNRISHRQLYRQIIMVFTAPFLLCLFGNQKTLGLSGIGGTLLALLMLFFYVIFLMRLSHGFAAPCKTVGKIGGRAVGLFFLFYCCLTAVFLLNLLGKIVSVSLGTGISRGWLCFMALMVCSYGTYGGFQRRGRIAEVSGGLVLAAVVLMLLLSVWQGKWFYFEEMIWNSPLNAKLVFEYGYGILCAFSGLALLPFALENVEKAGSAGKTVIFAVMTLGVLLLLVELILPSVFGWKRLAYEANPILPLLAGADLPGNVLARFDVLWMGFLLYSLLFSIGSLLHYGHSIVEKSQIGTGKVWITVLVFVIYILLDRSVGIRKFYSVYLQNVYVPGMLLIQLFIFFAGRGKWRKKTKEDRENEHRENEHRENEHRENEYREDKYKENKTRVGNSQEEKAREGTCKEEKRKEENSKEEKTKAEKIREENSKEEKTKAEHNREDNSKKEMYRNKKNRSLKLLSGMCICLLILTGCGGVEPENRMYPLALGADFEDEKFTLTYGTPDLPEATGQEKDDENQGSAVPAISGRDFSEIEKIYSQTQEKYLDLGHLEILVLGENVLSAGKWETVLEYLKKEPFIGENVYVFQAENAAKAVGWSSPQKTSLGEYVLGILENAPNGSPKEAVTLRDVYYEWYERGGVPRLPEIEVGEEMVEIRF